jgi:hypothetical protein
MAFVASGSVTSEVTPMTGIERGALVVVQDASGALLRKRALSGIQAGHDFLVVWACREEEWEAAQAEGRKPEGVPWPADDVRLAQAEESEPAAMAS